MLADFHDDSVDFPPKPEKKPAAKKKAPEEGGEDKPAPKKAKKETLDIPAETREGARRRRATRLAQP